MSIKIIVSDTDAVVRQDTFRINPLDVKDGRNSRMIPAPDYKETVLKRALSIAKQGQLQPAEVRREDDKTLTLVSGYTRRDAINLLREGFTAIDPDSGEKAEFRDPSATLWVKVVDVGPDEAFLRSISENLQRKDTTDLQEALAQSELRTTMGWTDSKIARFYGYKNQNRVAALQKLLQLPEDVQVLVHSGKIALYTALDTLELDPETRATLLDGATDETGKVQGSVLRGLLRKLKDEPVPAIDAGETDEEGDAGEPEAGGKRTPAKPHDKTKRIPRTRKDLERFAAECSEADGSLTDAAGELLDVLVLWFKDQRTDEYLQNALNNYTKKGK